MRVLKPFGRTSNLFIRLPSHTPYSYMNYNNIVSSVRVAARDLLRLKATNRFRDELLELETAKSTLMKDFDQRNADRTFQIADLEFQLSEVKDRDPRAATKREALTARLTEAQNVAPSYVETHEKNLALLGGQITKTLEKIAKIQSGETKISKDELTQVANDLLSQFVKSEVSCLSGAEDEAAEVDPDAGVVSQES